MPDIPERLVYEMGSLLSGVDVGQAFYKPEYTAQYTDNKLLDREFVEMEMKPIKVKWGIFAMHLVQLLQSLGNPERKHCSLA